MTQAGGLVPVTLHVPPQPSGPVYVLPVGIDDGLGQVSVHVAEVQDVDVYSLGVFDSYEHLCFLAYSFIGPPPSK